jgi:hypothetical protein
MLYDRFVNSNDLSLVPHQETSSRFFVCSSPLAYQINSLSFDIADSGHSDQQPSSDIDEEDGKDEGLFSLVLH